MPKTYSKMNHSTGLKYHYVILTLIILSGFLLRIWGIWNVDSPDEYNEVFEALRVCSGDLNFERWGKRFYLYILSLAYGGYYFIGWVFQVFSSPMDFATKIVRNLDILFLIGRSVSAIFGTLSVFMTYVIGKSTFNARVGLIASLFLFLSLLHVKLSHFAIVEATLYLTTLISFYFIAQINLNNHNRGRHYFLAGLFSAIAFQTKVPAIVLLVPFLLSHMFRSKGKKPLEYIYSKELSYYICAFALGLIISNPAILLAFPKFLASFLSYKNVYTTSYNYTQSTHIGYTFYFMYLYKELGLLLTTLAIYSIARAAISKNRSEWLLLSFIVPFYLLVGGTKFMVYPRYIAPLMPFLFILAAKHLLQLVESFRVERKLSKAILVAACFLVLIQPFGNVVEFERSVSGKNTRILAKDWIENNIPFGTKILMDTGKSINTFGPKIVRNKESVLRLLHYQREAIEEHNTHQTRGLVTENSLIYYKLLLETIPERSYDITSTRFGMYVKSIDYYISKQYQYLVISKSKKQRARTYFFRTRYPKISHFYNSLDTDKRLSLVKTIGPSKRNTGDTYLIYKLPSGR